MERELGSKLTKEAKAKNRQSRRRNLKMSLRGSVARKAQHEVGLYMLDWFKDRVNEEVDS